MSTFKILWPGVLTSLVAIVAGLGVLAIGHQEPEADAHRPIPIRFAVGSANGYVRAHYCGAKAGLKCVGVAVPVVNSLNSHMFEFHGISFRECASFFGVCIPGTRHNCWANGTVNGHTGKVRVMSVSARCRR